MPKTLADLDFRPIPRSNRLSKWRSDEDEKSGDLREGQHGGTGD